MPFNIQRPCALWSHSFSSRTFWCRFFNRLLIQWIDDTYRIGRMHRISLRRSWQLPSSTLICSLFQHVLFCTSIHYNDDICNGKCISMYVLNKYIDMKLSCLFCFHAFIVQIFFSAMNFCWPYAQNFVQMQLTVTIINIDLLTFYNILDQT